MLKMLTGLVAKMIRLVDQDEPLAITDSEMLDWLDCQTGCQGCKSGLVAFRWSTTGRGWRLMEVAEDYLGTIQEGIVTPPSCEVRKAVAAAMLTVSPPTDTQMLDWLDQQTGLYTGKVLWRQSTRSLGWRLHETSRDGATKTVRETISVAMHAAVIQS